MNSRHLGSCRIVVQGQGDCGWPFDHHHGSGRRGRAPWIGNGRDKHLDLGRFFLFIWNVKRMTDSEGGSTFTLRNNATYIGRPDPGFRQRWLDSPPLGRTLGSTSWWWRRSLRGLQRRARQRGRTREICSSCKYPIRIRSRAWWHPISKQRDSFSVLPWCHFVIDSYQSDDERACSIAENVTGQDLESCSCRSASRDHDILTGTIQQLINIHVVSNVLTKLDLPKGYLPPGPSWDW